MAEDYHDVPPVGKSDELDRNAEWRAHVERCSICGPLRRLNAEREHIYAQAASASAIQDPRRRAAALRDVGAQDNALIFKR